MSQEPSQPKEKKAPMSVGEKIFDWLVYGGIAGIGTFIVTIPIAFFAKYGKGAGAFEKATDWLVKKGVHPDTAGQMMITNATMQGGNVMVLPVKWAEDNKVALVTKINDMLGEKTDVAALEAHDKQTWGSIIKARLVAWVAVFSSLKITGHVIGVDKFAKFEDGFSSLVCKIMKKPTHVAGAETRAFKYGKIAAIDVFATAAASTLLYIGSRIFAHVEREEKEPAHAHEPAPKVVAEEPAATLPESRKAADIIRSKKKDDSFAAAVGRKTDAQPSLQLGA